MNKMVKKEVLEMVSLLSIFQKKKTTPELGELDLPPAPPLDLDENSQENNSAPMDGDLPSSEDLEKELRELEDMQTAVDGNQKEEDALSLLPMTPPTEVSPKKSMKAVKEKKKGKKEATTLQEDSPAMFETLEQMKKETKELAPPSTDEISSSNSPVTQDKAEGKKLSHYVSRLFGKKQESEAEKSNDEVEKMFGEIDLEMPVEPKSEVSTPMMLTKTTQRAKESVEKTPRLDSIEKKLGEIQKLVEKKPTKQLTAGLSEMKTLKKEFYTQARLQGTIRSQNARIESVGKSMTELKEQVKEFKSEMVTKDMFADLKSELMKADKEMVERMGSELRAFASEKASKKHVTTKEFHEMLEKVMEAKMETHKEIEALSKELQRLRSSIPEEEQHYQGAFNSRLKELEEKFELFQERIERKLDQTLLSMPQEREESQKQPSAPTGTTDDFEGEAVKEFIRTHLQKGYAPQSIKAALVKKGWPSSLVEAYYLSVT